jgi:hypothetical protein
MFALAVEIIELLISNVRNVFWALKNLRTLGVQN